MENIFDVEPEQPPCPVNITPLVNPNVTVANDITVYWNADCTRDYALAAYLVRKLSSSDLIQRLKTHGARHSHFTRDLSKYTEVVSFHFSAVGVKIIVFPHMEHE